MTNKELTPEELKNEIVTRFKATESGFGNMTNREKKLVALSAQIAKEYAAKAVEKYKNDLYSKLTDFGCWSADLGKDQCKEQCEKCQVEYETQ
jgi:hypothetical protein